MHVLVAGGAGFIGSHVVDSLLNDGHRVTVVDNFDRFYERAIKDTNLESHRGHPGWRLIEKRDLRDLPGLRSTLLDNYDYIVHLAAKAGVRPSIEDPIGPPRVRARKPRFLRRRKRGRLYNPPSHVVP